MAHPHLLLVLRLVSVFKSVVEVLALVRKDQDIRLRCDVQAVGGVVPEDRLRDLRQGQQETLLQDRVAHLVCLLRWGVIWVCSKPLLLDEVNLTDAILLNLFQVIVPADCYFLSHEGDP